ncbi:hypothetical protein K502DRAFT_367354 [Neoconidiobolus thromboides FSU 785]|nr:hypothetical protein K502DRAFT_367354 [Neoconidiobolus thromboides FSU 785]
MTVENTQCIINTKIDLSKKMGYCPCLNVESIYYDYSIEDYENRDNFKDTLNSDFIDNHDDFYNIDNNGNNENDYCSYGDDYNSDDISNNSGINNNDKKSKEIEMNIELLKLKKLQINSVDFTRAHWNYSKIN